MKTDSNTTLGLAKIMADYERYVQKTEARNEKPLSILAYLAELFQ